MGFVLSVLYFLVYYLTPPCSWFGPLAEFRVELIIAVSYCSGINTQTGKFNCLQNVAVRGGD